jgi:iron complex outermembrane receptor protein
MEKLMTRNVLKPLGSVRVALAVAVGIPLFVFSHAYGQATAPAATGTQAGAAGEATQANASAGATGSGGGAQAEVERVIVTGSNIPTAEEVGPNPVDTYRRDDITRLGVRTSSDLIEKLPSVAGAGVTENNTNGGDGSARLDLRGIDPKETLILQDGRRLANVGFASSSPDFNMFPLGLIDHIDILKDGASPNYGADAVAGVVNVFMIHRFRGVEIYGSYGNSNLGRANDSAEESAYILAGTGDDKTDIVVYAGLYNRAAIFSRDNDITHDADFTPFGGPDPRSGNYAGRVQSGVYRPGLNTVTPGARTPTPHAFVNRANDPEYVPRLSLPREQQVFNFADLTPAVAATDREYLYGSVDRKICDQYLEVFADFRYVRQFWDGALAPAPFTPDMWTDAAHPFGISSAGFSVPIQNAFNPFTVPDYISPGGFNPTFPNTQASAPPPGTGFTTGVRYRGVEAGLRTDKIQTDNYLFTGGLRGELGEFGDFFKNWSWESGFRYNEDHRLERFGGIINNNALRTALLDTNPSTAFNPFGLNQNNKFVLNKVFVQTNHFGQQTEMVEDGRLNGQLFNLPAGPVSFAIGTEHRTEHTSDIPDPLTASGQTTGATNFAPTKGSRDAWSAWWEVSVPITSPSWNFPGLYSMELGYAERYENFSDFGETERPKFTVRIQPIEGITLRAAYIEAFHAPALGELFSGTAQSFPTVTDPLPNTATEAQVEQHLLGNQTLQPETAYEWTYGGVITFDKIWSPLQGLTLSADVVHIDLRSYTTTLDPQFVINNASGNANPGGAFGPFNSAGSGVFPTFVGGPGPININFVQRDPVTGAIVLINTPEVNTGQLICDDLDYEAVYTLQTTRFGHGDMGTLTTTFNGTYIFDRQLRPTPFSPILEVSGKFGGGFQGTVTGGGYTHDRWYSSVFYDGPAGSWLGGLDAGATVHYVGQYWDSRGTETSFNKNGDKQNRKIREWITLDLIVNYTFNFPAPTAQTDVAGYNKDGGKNVKMKDGKDKNVMPVSTAEYNPCGWRAWLNNTTVTLGMNNVTDEEPPFVAGSFENGYDENTANVKGRFWYVALKKRF